MNLKLLLCFPVVAIIGFTTTAQAQRGGFAIAVAPAASINAPVQPFIQPFINPPVQPFGVGSPSVLGFGFGVMPAVVPPVVTTFNSPIWNQPTQSPAIAVQPQGFYARTHGVSGFAGNGVTIIVPNGTVITNGAVVVQQPPAQTFRNGPNPVFPAPSPRPAFNAPLIGTPRTQVIQQYGTPATSILTPNGETLYFGGGVTIYIQDGKVAPPQRPN